MLIELLMAMIMGIIVSGALYAILNTTLLQSSRVFSRVDATQRSRLALENIESLLHSSCVSESVTPITAGSTGTSMTFVSKYGGAATLTLVQHTISLSAGTLTDSSYAATGGAAPNWIFASTPTSTRTLLTNVSASGSTPIFQYFGYEAANDASGNAYHDSSGNPFQMLLDGSLSLPSGATTSAGVAVAAGTVPANSPAPLLTPLSAGDADSTAEVLIKMVVGPGGASNLNKNLSDVSSTVTDSVVLRLTPVVSDGSTNQQVSPCA